MHALLQGACVVAGRGACVAAGGMCGCWGACVVVGACMVGGGMCRI